jgi:inorganic triphosphatase YgiF
MGLEIEAKFRVDDDLIFNRLPRLASLGRFQLVPEHDIERQHNIYLDTPDARLEAVGYSLRVREVAGRRVATLKRSRSRQGNLRIRDEWETTPGPSDDPRGWPASGLRARVLAAIGGAPVEPLFVVETHRQHIFARRDDRPFAVLCLDHGLVWAGDREAAFRELEVELLDQRERASFDTLVELLHTRFPLFPEERTKKARGLALRAEALSLALSVGG